jgi:glycerol-3-phosphate dehydrogenase
MERLATERFDLAVIGAGMTGVGVALDAAARGLSVALLDKADLASGTSSKSSKLVHGGLRYLQHGELSLVHEGLIERQRLLQNAFPLVQPLPFVIPLYRTGTPLDWVMVPGYSAALWGYDLAGGLRIGARHRRLDRSGVLRDLPWLSPEGLQAGFRYFDAAADDCRLGLQVARSAIERFGAVVLTYAGVSALERGSSGRVEALSVQPSAPDDDSGPLEVRARAVVNAAGVWSDELRSMVSSAPPGLVPAKGVHFALRSESLPTERAAALPVPGEGRLIFVIPAGPFTYVGTTDTPYSGDVDQVRCEADDLGYLLEAVNGHLARPISVGEVTGVWAGLRPLLAAGGASATSMGSGTADMSRRHSVSAREGMVTVTGGKLTTYRQMAEDAVDLVLEILGEPARRSPTKQLQLLGSLPGPKRPASAGSADLGSSGGDLPPEVLTELVRRHGSETSSVLALIAEDPSLAEPIAPGLPWLAAEVLWAARHELVTCLDDVLARRTRAAIYDTRAAWEAAPGVAERLAGELGWTPGRAESEVETCRRALVADLEAAGLRPPAGVAPA